MCLKSENLCLVVCYKTLTFEHLYVTENMAMISRMKLLRTSLQATRTKWMWWPGKESAEDAGLSNSSLFDDKNRLMHIDPGRFVLFNGRWYFPPVTVRPTFELWDHSNLSLVEPKGSSVFSSLFR